MTPLMPTTKVFFFDIEGHGLECRWNATMPVYFVGILAVDEDGNKRIHKFYSVEPAIEYIQQYLNAGWVGFAHNAKFDLCTLNSRGLGHTISKGIPSVGCTMVMEYTRATNLPSYSLDALTGMKTDIVATAHERGLLQVNLNKTSFWSIDWADNKAMVEHIAEYCCDDLKATYYLYKKLAAWYNQPDNEKYRESLFNLEFPMLSVLEHMERAGIATDASVLEKLTEDVSRELSKHTETMSKVAVNLPKLQWKEDHYEPVAKTYTKPKYQAPANISYYLDSDGRVVTTSAVCDKKTGTVSYIIYDHCTLNNYNSAAATGHTFWLLNSQCPEVLESCEYTPTGRPKLNKDFFADVAEQMPDNLPISKFLKSTKDLQICHTIAEHIRDGRIHGSFNNCLTRTSRLSSSNPNLQNISRSDKEPTSIASRFRQVFAAPEGKVMLVADIDRIELCVLAWYLKVAMKDSSLADVCNTPGSDVHQANADKWGLSRTVAKTLIFLLVYGGGAGLIFRRGMAKTLEEAQSMVDTVDREQPSINKLKSSVWATARKRGFVTNPFAARGIYPELNSKRKWEVGRGERQSFNFLIQRTARDILHSLLVDSLPIVLNYQAMIVNVVHDEIIIECDAVVADALMIALNKIWQKRTDFLPGIIINGDFNKGQTWYHAKG